MTETELLEALLAELREYGEVFIPDEDIVDLPSTSWQELQRELSGRLQDVLLTTYDMQKCGYLIKRIERKPRYGYDTPVPPRGFSFKEGEESEFVLQDWQKVWLKDYLRKRDGQ